MKKGVGWKRETDMEHRRGSCSSDLSPWHAIPGTSPSAPSGTVVTTVTPGSQIPHTSLFIIMTHSCICLSIKVIPICQSLDGLPLFSPAFRFLLFMWSPSPPLTTYSNAKHRIIHSTSPSSHPEKLFLHLPSEEGRLREGTHLTQGHTAGKQVRRLRFAPSSSDHRAQGPSAPP